MHKTELTLAQKILQTLLYFGEAISFTEIAKFLNLKKEEIVEQIEEKKLEELAQALGLNLIISENNLELVLNEEISKIINSNKITQLKEDLSESSLEVLSITLYKEKASKAEIDFIRGVDSSRSIKSLLLRGLIEKTVIKNRTYYSPSTETLKYLNINKQHDLIEFKNISDKLKNLIEGKDE